MTSSIQRPRIERRPFDLHIGDTRINAVWLTPDVPVAEAAPLIFLHEGLGSIPQWTARGIDAPARLVEATGRPALVYERQGYGHSAPLTAPRHPRYLYDEAWQALPQVLDAAGIDRVVPVGHSDGGSIALLFAARFPDRTDRLVSEAAHVVVEDVTLAGIRDAKRAYDEPDSRLKAALQRHHGDGTDAVFAAWADAWLSVDFRDLDICDQLPAVTAPVLAIQGDGDEYGTPRQLDLIAEGVSGPVETWLVPDCGHVPHHQAADRVLPRIAEFCSP